MAMNYIIVEKPHRWSDPKSFLTYYTKDAAVDNWSHRLRAHCANRLNTMGVLPDGVDAHEAFAVLRLQEFEHLLTEARAAAALGLGQGEWGQGYR